MEWWCPIRLVMACDWWDDVVSTCCSTKGGELKTCYHVPVVVGACCLLSSVVIRSLRSTTPHPTSFNNHRCCWQAAQANIPILVGPGFAWPRIEFGQMKEVASKNDPGDYYGIKFPYTKDFWDLFFVETLAGWLPKIAGSRFPRNPAILMA